MKAPTCGCPLSSTPLCRLSLCCSHWLFGRTVCPVNKKILKYFLFFYTDTQKVFILQSNYFLLCLSFDGETISTNGDSSKYETMLAVLLTILLGTVETITMKPRLALTLEGSQSIDTSSIDVTRRGAALIYICKTGEEQISHHTSRKLCNWNVENSLNIQMYADI